MAPAPAVHRRRWSRIWFGTLTCVLAACCYFLFAGAFGKTEWVYAGLATIPAVVWTLLVNDLTEHRLYPSAPWLFLFRRVLGFLGKDTYRVGIALITVIVRRPTGSLGAFVRQPFRIGSDADAGRRALGVLSVSLAPNQYVVRLEQSPDMLLLHTLVRQPTQSESRVAPMSVWSLTTLALLPPFAVPVLMMLRGSPATRLAALQLASAVASLLLILMTFVFDQASFIDVALSLALLTLPGTLLMALFYERWL